MKKLCFVVGIVDMFFSAPLQTKCNNSCYFKIQIQIENINFAILPQLLLTGPIPSRSLRVTTWPDQQTTCCTVWTQCTSLNTAGPGQAGHSNPYNCQLSQHVNLLHSRTVTDVVLVSISKIAETSQVNLTLHGIHCLYVL